MQEDNVIQLQPNFRQRTEKYFVYLGEISPYGEIQEKAAVGVGLQKEGSSNFRLKLWMFHKTPYLIVPVKTDRTRYDIYSVEDHPHNRELKSFWNKIGEGRLCGNYLKLSLHLLGQDLFMSLFPSNQPNQNKEVA